jgi:peptide/nickel transport system substrate-binding protein
MPRRISITLAAILILSAVQCGNRQANHSANQKEPPEKVLRYDVNSPFGSLRPYTVDSSGSTAIFPLLYSYLFVPDAKGVLQPDLATRWTYDPDKWCWKIVLRTNARFHNRQPVTAKDVKYSLEKWINNFSPPLAETIDRIEQLGVYMLALYLKKEDPTILHKLWAKEIIPHMGGGKADAEYYPAGSGPFKFSHRQGNRQVVLEVNKDYYGHRPYLDRIVFYHQPNREKSWTRLLAGATDIAEEISPRNYEIMQQYKHRFYFDQYTLRYFSILLYNIYDPLFSSPMVRKALTMGIDRDHIVRRILRGYGRVATGPMGVDSPFCHPDVAPLPYDPHKALDMLKKAGWRPNKKGRLYKNNRPFEFTLLVFKESQTEKNVARFIQLSLNDLGITVHLKALSFDALMKRYSKNSSFQAILTEMSGAYRNPEHMLQLWSPGRHGKAIVGCFSHPAVTRLLQNATNEKRHPVQRKLLQKTDALIVDLQPGTFLFHKTALDTMSRRFYLPHPFKLTLEGVYRLQFASPEAN